MCLCVKSIISLVVNMYDQDERWRRGGGDGGRRNAGVAGGRLTKSFEYLSSLSSSSSLLLWVWV